jgi:hypothetical protein
MQLAPSLHRLGPSSLVNSYLVEDAGAITVIDAGLRGHWKDLLRELEAKYPSQPPSGIRCGWPHGQVPCLCAHARWYEEHTDGDAWTRGLTEALRLIRAAWAERVA